MSSSSVGKKDSPVKLVKETWPPGYYECPRRKPLFKPLKECQGGGDFPVDMGLPGVKSGVKLS
jgi:hypothetical protein